MVETGFFGFFVFIETEESGLQVLKFILEGFFKLLVLCSSRVGCFIKD